ncbi:MAG: DsbA family protein [Patescibacteria group bacterium]
MKKETAILIIVILIIGGFLFLTKLKFLQKPVNNNQQTEITPIEDLSANVIQGQKNSSSTSQATIPPIGNSNAPVKIFIFADYQCPVCKSLFLETETQIREEFVKKGLAVIYFKDYAFLGEESFLAANAARCANEQSKFWEYHDLLFEKQGTENSGVFSKDNLKTFGDSLELNTKKFNECIDNEKYKQYIIKDFEDGRKLGVQGTPFLLINDKQVAGLYPYKTIRLVILKELQAR